MTRTRSLLITLALVLSVPAVAGAATVTAAKPCYVNGDEIALSGRGFAPDGPVSFRVNDNNIGGSVITNGEGEFKATYTPPASEAEDKLVIRATDSEGTVARTKLFVTRERRVTADPETTSNVKKWKAVFRLYGFGRKKKAYVHFVAPSGKHKKTKRLGKLKGPCGRLKTDKRRVLPFRNPAFGTWKLQFDTKRRYRKNTARKRVIPVRVFQG